MIFCNLVYSAPAITSLLFNTSSSDRVFVTFLYKNKNASYLMRVSHLSRLCDGSKQTKKKKNVYPGCVQSYGSG